MHFAFTSEQAMIAETAASLFAEAATSERTRAAMADGIGLDRALWAEFSEIGLAGVALPEVYGGAGLGMVELAILAEAAGRHVAAMPFISSSAMAASAIAAGGSEAQRAEWLPRLASGEAIGTLALGSADATLFDFVPHGGVADLFVVAAGDRLALVTRDRVTIAPTVTMDQTRPLARVSLDAAAGEALPFSGDALAAAQAAGCVAIAADALGGAQACLDRTVGYARERIQFGRPIGSFQAVKHRLADMMVEIEQARSAVYWAACALDEGSADAAMAVHAAKAFAADTYSACAGAMIQLHGGIGFTWEHDAHLFFKRARADRTLLGTPEWHREQIARLIGLESIAA
jgi:alkylation response protein AidB-like acyl-CoA dehydrogenase